MLKIIFLMIIVLVMHSVELFADVCVKSGFDKSGSFYNRLQFDGESMDFSLLASISNSGLEWIEPVFLMKSLYIGRIQLKGIVREFHNPDGSSSLASVLLEPSGLRVTDAISRSSRYGVLITPFDDYDFSGWMYRANNGIFSIGIMYSQPNIFPKSVLSMDGDIMITAGCCEECSDSDWFSSKAVLPRQIGFNTATELRFSTDGCHGGGRRSLLPDGDEIAWSLSIATSISLPQYTVPGCLFRAVSFSGVENLYVSGFFQSVSPDYISAAGTLSDYRFITGAGVCGSTYGDCCGISGKIDFCLKQKMPEIIPARFAEQARSLNGRLELSAGMFILKLEGSFRSVCESCGTESAKTAAEACLKFDAGIIVLDIGCGMDYEAEDNIVDWQSPCFDGGVLFALESLKLGFRCGYEDQILSFEINTGLVMETYRISGSIKCENEAVTGLSIGFEL